MGLETGTYINDLVITNPLANDPESQGDDHLRLIKTVLKNSFAGFSGMLFATGSEAQGASANDYTVTVSPAPAAYSTNSFVVSKATHTNTGAATLQINGLGTKNLLASNGLPLKAGDLPIGSPFIAYYDGVAFYLFKGSPSVSSVLQMAILTDPQFGAVGDGTTNDTTAVQAAFNSGFSTIFIPPKTFKVGAITVPSTVKYIYGVPGSVLLQAAADSNILNLSNPADVQIEGVTFQGVGGSVVASSNHGIHIDGGNRATVRKCVFTALRFSGVWVGGTADIKLIDNLVYNCAAGLHFRGVTVGTIRGNTIRDTSLPNTTFTTAIQLESTQGHALGPCQDITIDDNIVRNFVNSQGVLVHAGVNITVENNILDNVMMGVSVNAAVSTDTLQDITVANNQVNGTLTSFAGPTSGVLIQISGFSGAVRAVNGLIAGNILRSGNAILLDANAGAIATSFSDGVRIADNQIAQSYGNGIAVGLTGTESIVGCVVENNTIKGMLTASGANAGILVRGTGVEAQVRRNRIYSATNGVNVATNLYPNVVCDNNLFTSVTTNYPSPNNAITEGVGVYTAGQTTFSVEGGQVRSLLIANSGPVSITNITNGNDGNILTMRFADANTTLTRANAVLAGGVNFVSVNNGILQLLKSGSFWHEVSRAMTNA